LTSTISRTKSYRLWLRHWKPNREMKMGRMTGKRKKEKGKLGLGIQTLTMSIFKTLKAFTSRMTPTLNIKIQILEPISSTRIFVRE
jgi:hypothetical protein